MRARHHEVALSERGERHGHVEHVLGFESEVELLGDGLREQLDERRRVGQRGHRDPPDQVRGQPGHHRQVLGDAPGHVWSLHLHHDGCPVEKLRRVHLRDGGRRQRDPLHRGEHLVDRAAEVLGQDPLHHGPGLCRYLVAAPLELGHELGREDALARGDDLSELDVGRPEPLGRLPQAARDPGHRLRAAGTSLLEVPQADGAAQVAHRRDHARAGRHQPRSDQRGEGCDEPGAAGQRSCGAIAVASGSTIHGPLSLKAPMAVSGAVTSRSLLAAGHDPGRRVAAQ